MGISIAIPFYNAERFLLNSIQSVFAQTYKEWELLLIDDGSTDGSLRIAQSIKDERVHVISDGQNRRLAARLNQVPSLAKYEYIARMDADDMMAPERLEIQLAILESRPDLDLVSTGMYSCSDNDEILGYRGANWEMPSFEDIYKKRVGILHASLLARKSWYERNRYNESLKVGQDTELWFRASSKGDFKIKVIDQPLYIYREEGNVSPQKLLRAYKNEREFLVKFLPRHERTRFVVNSYMKSLFVNLFGAPKLLLNRRNAIVSDDDSNNFAKILEIIRKQNLDL